MRERGVTSLVVLATVIAITMVWWALALWPVNDTPVWLERTRDVCFGTRSNGLPDVAGWTVLVLQPAMMVGAVVVIWGRTLVRDLAAFARLPGGRLALRGTGVVLLVAITAAAWRVASASSANAFDEITAAPLPDTYPRLDRPAPELGLVDQRGDTVRLGDNRGHVVLVTFAFGHCETVCPKIVSDVLVARRRLTDQGHAVRAVVVTLDPWRDVPSRLPYLAQRWHLGEGDFMLSGAVQNVEAALDAWGVARRRDLRTGDVTHPALAYIVDPDGIIAYGVVGGADAIVELVGRL